MHRSPATFGLLLVLVSACANSGANIAERAMPDFHPAFTKALRLTSGRLSRSRSLKHFTAPAAKPSPPPPSDTAIGSGSVEVGTDSSDAVRRFQRYKRTLEASNIEGKAAVSFSAISAALGAAKICSLRV